MAKGDSPKSHSLGNNTLSRHISQENIYLPQIHAHVSLPVSRTPRYYERSPDSEGAGLGLRLGVIY